MGLSYDTRNQLRDKYFLGTCSNRHSSGATNFTMTTSCFGGQILTSHRPENYHLDFEVRKLMMLQHTRTNLKDQGDNQMQPNKTLDNICFNL